jgi:hypothetical protein
MILRTITLTLLLATALSASGCSSLCTAPEATGNDTLYRTWMESHEERSSETAIYRDSTFSFPPARGRQGFTVERSGDFIWHRIAPTDGTMDVPARWRFENGSSNILIISDPATGQETDRITIISIEPAVLKVRR